MTDTIRIFQKRAPRYDVKCPDTVTAVIQELDGASEPLPAELANISECGAKLKTAKSYSVKETFFLKINVEEPSYSFEVTAKVCWVSPVVGDGWWLGCSLKPALPITVLDEFAQAGLIERREHRRQPVSLTAIAKWELASKSSFARIVDCSKGGFCMLSQLEGKPGERVQLQFEGNGQHQVQVRGKVVWQVESNEGYVLGCEFLDPQDFSVVTDLETSRRRSGSKQQLAWKWFKPHAQTDTSDAHCQELTTRRPSYRATIAFAATLVCFVLWGIQGASAPWIQQPKSANSQASTVVWETTDRADIRSPADFASVNGPLVDQIATGEPVAIDPPLAPHEMVLQKPLVQNLVARQGGLSAERQFAARDVSTSDVVPRRVDSHNAAYPVSIEHCIDESDRRPTFADLAKTSAVVCPTLSQEATFPSDWHDVSHAMASKALHDSRGFYQLKKYDRAIESLHTAIRLDANNAEYLFVLAIIQYQLGRSDEAEQSVMTAVALEERQPVENWGDSMQRFQGAARVWLEDTRRRMRTQ